MCSQTSGGNRPGWEPALMMSQFPTTGRGLSGARLMNYFTAGQRNLMRDLPQKHWRRQRQLCADTGEK